MGDLNGKEKIMSKSKPLKIFSIILMALIAGCSEQVSNSLDGSGDWLIPVDQIFDGGPGKDGIPAVSSPKFTDSDILAFLDDNDLVIGINIGGEIRAYPHPILDWHEIVNDKIGSNAFAVTYCPLTGSGVGWNRVLNGVEITFGVSGNLYNTNLMPYDRATNSNWSQMKLQCVNGDLIGQEAELVPLIETTWKTWKEMYPGSNVMTNNTGYTKPYGVFPYGDYKVNHNRLIFPVSPDDGRLPRKERVLGVIVGDLSKVYQISRFSSEMETINDNFNGEPIIVAGSNGKNIAVAYNRQLTDGTTLTFESVGGALPIIMKDNEGTSWDIFGIAVDGPRKGTRLIPADSFISYWFAWGAFFPGAEIHSF
jgi:hypothetical protein